MAAVAAVVEVAAVARKNVINADGGDAYRFNWNTPFILSPHNPDII